MSTDRHQSDVDACTAANNQAQGPLATLDTETEIHDAPAGRLIAIDERETGIAVVAFVPDEAAVCDAQYVAADVRKALESAAATDDGPGGGD